MRTFILLSLFIAFLNIKAQTIELQGLVEDAFLKVPLPEATVSVLTTDSVVIVEKAQMYRINGADGRLQMAIFCANVKAEPATYLVRATLHGYGDVWQRVSVTDVSKKSVDVPKILMRKIREQQLGEATVTATRVKMYYKGDTLVYNADAFKLPDGSMLDGLIRQLPGVTMNDGGEIFVNGRKIDELLLGARSFMKGNKQVLLENLPYYTVNDIKVYDKQTDKSEALGYDVEARKFVMDVNLKKEYRRGYIANLEAAGGTEDRWLGRAFVLGFTDRWRLSLMGNTNNVNETRHIGQSGYWTPTQMPRSLTTTRSVKGEADYQSKGNTWQNTLYSEYTSTTDRAESRRNYEQFLAGSMPRSISTLTSRNGSRRWNVNDALMLKKPFYLSAAADFKYAKRDGSFNSTFEQWLCKREERKSEASFAFSLPSAARQAQSEWNDSLTASSRAVGMSEGTAWSITAHANGAFNVGKNGQHVNFAAWIEHKSDESQSATSYDTWQSAQLATSSRQHNTNDISNRTTWGTVGMSYATQISKKVHMSLSEGVDFMHINAHDYLFHPDTLTLSSQAEALAALTDYNNSYRSRYSSVQNNVSLSFTEKASYSYPNSPINISYDRWRVNLELPVRHESLRYQRGSLDTLANQNSVFLNAAASYAFVWEAGKRRLNFNAGHSRQSAELSDRITYHDDSTPLVVKIGNPDLKGKAVSDFSVRYEDKTGKQQQQYGLALNFNYHHRDVAQSSVYSPATSVYTYKPMNVKGAYTLSGTFDFSRAIDKKKRWTWQTNLSANYHHSVDHAMLADETESHVNKVNTLTLRDATYIQYSRNAFNVRASASVNWRHSEGKMRDFETLNATDYNYGISTTYTIPRIKTTLSLDGTMYSRRGYGSSTLNTDDFVLNASLSQSFLKGRLVARIEGFDLLHQLSSTQYEVNAQGRTETWYRSLPRYVMLHVVYHWSKSPKK